jgi:hypothetical protein
MNFRGSDMIQFVKLQNSNAVTLNSENVGLKLSQKNGLAQMVGKMKCCETNSLRNPAKIKRIIFRKPVPIHQAVDGLSGRTNGRSFLTSPF